MGWFEIMLIIQQKNVSRVREAIYKDRRFWILILEAIVMDSGNRKGRISEISFVLFVYIIN